MLIQQERNGPIQQTSQVPPPGKTPSRHTVVLALLGVALPLVAGSMLWWIWGLWGLWGLPERFSNEWSLPIIALAAAGSVIIGACLLYLTFRVGWAALLALLAWVMGEFLGAVVVTLVLGGAEQFWMGQFTILGMAIWPLFFCLVVGVLGGVAVERWRSRRAGRGIQH